MSIPPQLIRVKRKRDEDAAPVTFLQFEDGTTKRHRTGTNWVYQRREVTASASGLVPRPPQAVMPVIHVSKPQNESPSAPGTGSSETTAPKPRVISLRPSQQRLKPEPRRFHLSRAVMTAANNNTAGQGISKKSRSSPAVFVERRQKQMAEKIRQKLGGANGSQDALRQSNGPEREKATDANEPVRLYKKPRTPRARSPQPDTPSRVPLPDSFSKPHGVNMDQRTADMNQWVLNEIGANLQEMERESQKQQSPKLKFRPKAPEKRFAERHPEQTAGLQVPSSSDTPMTDASGEDGMEEDGDDGDWVIDEYVRIPAHSMAMDTSPADVGVLVLEGEEDDYLFFGPEREDDDDLIDEDEDENAENHYTADYPEDEVESDDEFGRNPYHYRNMNASDDEEFDNDRYSEASDDMVLEGDDDDLTMARIKNYMRRKPDMPMRSRP
ncbi:hypothetical protein V2G26_013867 [Clonostachys chloroleuca]